MFVRRCVKKQTILPLKKKMMSNKWKRDNKAKLPSPPRRKNRIPKLPPSVRVFSRTHGGLERPVVWAWAVAMRELLEGLKPRPEAVDVTHREALEACFSRRATEGDDPGRRFCFEAAWMRLRKVWERQSGVRFVLLYSPAIKGGAGLRCPGWLGSFSRPAARTAC